MRHAEHVAPAQPMSQTQAPPLPSSHVPCASHSAHGVQSAPKWPGAHVALVEPAQPALQVQLPPRPGVQVPCCWQSTQRKSQAAP